MPWPFAAFVVQIECDLGGAIAFVGDEEKSFFCFLFELDAKVFQSKSGTTPAAHAVRRVTSLNFNPDAPQHDAIQSQHAHDQAQAERATGERSPDPFCLQMRPPESDREQSKTGKSERVPVRGGGFIE